MDTVLTTVYLLLLFGLMAYWPIQVVAVLAARGQERWIVLAVFAAGSLLTAFAADPATTTSNMPPVSWTAVATLADVALIALVVRSWLRPRYAGGSAQMKPPPAAVKRNVASPF